MIFIYLVIELAETEMKLALLKKGSDTVFNFEKFTCNKDEIKDILASYVAKHKPKKAVLVLKDDRIFKRFEVVPIMEETELKKMIDLNQSTYFPVNNDEYIMDYKILHKSKKELFLMIVSVMKSTINDYLKITNSLHLEVCLIDFYQNVIGDFFGPRLTEKTFVINSYKDRFSFTYLMSGYILNIRDIVISEETEVLRLVNKSFGFYKNEIFEIKNLVFLNEMPLISEFFSNYRANIYSDMEKDFNLTSDLLSFAAIAESKRF